MTGRQVLYSQTQDQRHELETNRRSQVKRSRGDITPEEMINDLMVIVDKSKQE